jgi:hypothetical protein
MAPLAPGSRAIDPSAAEEVNQETHHFLVRWQGNTPTGGNHGIALKPRATETSKHIGPSTRRPVLCIRPACGAQKMVRYLADRIESFLGTKMINRALGSCATAHGHRVGLALRQAPLR